MQEQGSFYQDDASFW